jgi:hypothetical protein
MDTVLPKILLLFELLATIACLSIKLDAPGNDFMAVSINSLASYNFDCADL